MESKEKGSPSKGPERSGGPFDGAAPGGGHSPEVPERALRRRFSAQYKLRIVEEAEACTEPGEIAALLRREGLFSSNLSRWRREYRAGALKSLASRKTGPKSTKSGVAARENARLKKEVARLQRKLKRAETLLSIQKKVSDILEQDLHDDEHTENG